MPNAGWGQRGAPEERASDMNIAVVLPGWIGDAVMATPALRALRYHFAACRISSAS